MDHLLRTTLHACTMNEMPPQGFGKFNAALYGAVESGRFSAMCDTIVPQVCSSGRCGSNRHRLPTIGQRLAEQCAKLDSLDESTSNGDKTLLSSGSARCVR